MQENKLTEKYVIKKQNKPPVFVFPTKSFVSYVKKRMIYPFEIQKQALNTNQYGIVAN